MPCTTIFATADNCNRLLKPPPERASQTGDYRIQPFANQIESTNVGGGCVPRRVKETFTQSSGSQSFAQQLKMNGMETNFMMQHLRLFVIIVRATIYLTAFG